MIAIYNRDWKGLCKLILGTLVGLGVTLAAGFLFPAYVITGGLAAGLSQYIVEDIIIDNISF